MTEKELKDRWKAEFDELVQERDRVILILSPLEAWAVLATIQLALRHPTNTGPTSEIARKVGRLIEEKVATRPVMQIVAERGWNPAYDETTAREG